MNHALTDLDCPECGMAGILERIAWQRAARTPCRPCKWTCPKCRSVSLIIIHNGSASLYSQDKGDQ